MENVIFKSPEGMRVTILPLSESLVDKKAPLTCRIQQRPSTLKSQGVRRRITNIEENSAMEMRNAMITKLMRMQVVKHKTIGM